MHENLLKLQELTNQIHEKDVQLQNTKDTYRSLVELLPVVVVVHINNKIEFINEYGLKVFGYSSKEEVIGRTISDFIHPKEIDIASKLLSELENTCKQEDFVELQLIKEDGSIILGEIGSSKIMWNGKQAIQSVIRDITKRRNIENALIKYYYKTGKLDSLPIAGQSNYEITDGWNIFLLYRNSKKDIFHTEAESGTTLPIHHHIQNEEIKMLSGELKLIFGDNEVVLHKNDVYKIPSMVKHKMVALEDSEFEVTFTPPLSQE